MEKQLKRAYLSIEAFTELLELPPGVHVKKVGYDFTRDCVIFDYEADFAYLGNKAHGETIYTSEASGCKSCGRWYGWNPKKKVITDLADLTANHVDLITEYDYECNHCGAPPQSVREIKYDA